MDPRNPHNSYRYKPMDQAAPIYVPPSHSTQRTLPVPQKEGQGDYHYGRPGDAAPVYIPPSSQESKRASRMKPNIALSDKHSKEEIQRLSSTNDALMKALDDSSAKTGGNMPPTEYPRLPSHTRFEDDPAANKVAAQNVGIQHATQPQAPRPPQVAPPPVPAPPMPAPSPQAMQPSPQQQNFGRSANPAFNVNQGMPDMSALDEAYKRQSMGG